MSSTIEEQRSMNLGILDEDGDVEIANIEDPVQFLLHSAQNYSNIISPSIQMISSRIRDLNPTVFNPRQVSIGPLHKKNKNLQAFEGQKAIFLHDLLFHSSLQPEQTLETCVKKVKASIGIIKACYGDGIKGYTDNDITKMMVTDGCFILEFIYKLSNSLFDKNMVIEPISMVFDLMLIENQIPFFVLQDIFECTYSRFLTSLDELVIHGLLPFLPFVELKLRNKNNEVSNKAHKHILGFIHEWYKPLGDVKTIEFSDLQKEIETIRSSGLTKDVQKNQSSNSQRFYSALELDRAGVNFKPHHQPQDLQWPMEIKLELPRFSLLRPWAMPTLRLPLLVIHSHTELIFRNLIAYEQLSPYGDLQYVTSYVTVMDLLIDNHEDVAILVKSKVVSNAIGSNEEAAKLINDMRKEISSPHLLYIKLWKEMNWYQDRFWPRNIAWLRRTYFSNPWSVIALFAGIFLFLFTMVQTYFTVNPV